MTSWCIAPSLVDGHLGPLLWSDASSRDGRDTLWLADRTCDRRRCQRLVMPLLVAMISRRHYWIRNQVNAEQSRHPRGATSTTSDHERLIWRRDSIFSVCTFCTNGDNHHHHQVLFQATWPTHIIHTKTHNAHKNTKKHRKHIEHTKK